MLGAVVGDFIGSVYEFNPVKSKEFNLFDEQSKFIDDSVMTCAIADALLGDADFGASIRRVGAHCMESGYGLSFYRWIDGHIKGPYGSYGNGSAMRVSPVAWACETESTALAIFLARKGANKETIKREIEGRFGYDLSRRLDAVRPAYGFAETMAAITGSIAEAYWGCVPDFLLSRAIHLLDKRLFSIAPAFCRRRRPIEAERLHRLHDTITTGKSRMENV